MKTPQRSASAVVLVLLLSMLGLGGAGLSPASGATSTKPVSGCEKGVTDPANLSASRDVARCTTGNPAPKPLATMTTVKMASAFKLEFNSPVLLADSLGEFAKENIKLELVNLQLRRRRAAARLGSARRRDRRHRDRAVQRRQPGPPREGRDGQLLPARRR